MDVLEKFLTGEAPKESRPVYNPGNLRPPGASTGFQQFKTPQEGIKAADANLEAYGKKGINTLRGVISRWAPPNENDTEAYIKNVSQRIGLKPDEPIDLSDPVQRHVISGAMFTHEQGVKNLFKSGQKAQQVAAEPVAQSGDPLERFLSGAPISEKPGEPETPEAKPEPTTKTGKVAQKLATDAITQAQKVAQAKEQLTPESVASGLDILAGGVTSALQLPGYWAGRAFGLTPEESKAASGKITEPLAQPVGRITGVSETPAYQQSLPSKIAEKVGEKAEQYIVKPIAEKTGQSPIDVEMALGTIAAALPAKAKIQQQFAKLKAKPPLGEQALTPAPSLATDVNIPPAQRAAIQAKMTAEPAAMAPADIATMQAQFEAKKGAIPKAQAPASPDVPVTPLPVGNEEAKRLIGVGAAEVTPEKLRVQRAKDLPIPIELSKDQATRDPADVRFARETAKDPVLGQALQTKYADDNLKIQKNLDHFIESTGAEFTGAAPGEVGQMLVNAVAPYQQARKNAIGPAYDAARAAGEMNMPVPVNRLTDFVEKNQSAAKNAPVISAVQSEIQRLAKGGEITINDLEEIRKMANILAQDQGPNSHYGKQAIRIIDKMTEGKGGELYQKARRLNAEYMREFEDTPVVKNLLAMKRGTTQRAVAIEDLVEKSMLKGPKSDVVQLFSTLQKAGPEGQQMINELRGYVAQRIKDEATKGVGRDINGLPYVSTHGLNKMIVDLDRSGKLDLLFGKQGAEHYRTLNEVTKDLQTVPVGTTNPSGTASTLLAAMAEMGAQTAMTGVPVPVVMAGKHIYGQMQTKKKLGKIQDFINYSKEK